MVDESTVAPHGRDSNGVPLAPFGLTRAGHPRKTAAGRPRKTGGSAPRRKSAARKPRSSAQPRSYVEGVAGLLQMAAFGLQMAGRTRPVFSADAAAIALHGEGVAIAVDDLAQENPEIAAVLDRFLKAGPYGALLTAVAPMAFQLLANRGVLAPGMMGTVDPGHLVREAQFQAEQMMQHQAAQAASPAPAPVFPSPADLADIPESAWVDEPSAAGDPLDPGNIPAEWSEHGAPAGG